MNFAALLVLLGLMRTMCNSSPSCPEGCVYTDRHHQQHFRHVLDLQNSSVAPWNMTRDSEEGREPQFIEYAVCKDCTVKDMIAKPIYLTISVYQMIRTNSDPAWCKCPYDLAVGCTCVSAAASH